MEEQETPKLETELSVENPNHEMEINEKPQFLNVLCILTFIGSGFGILSSLGFILAYDWLMAVIENGPMAGEVDLTQSQFAIGLLLSISSLIGAIWMYKLKKLGFFIYAAANAIAAFLPEYSTFTLVFNAIWIAMYSANFKHLKY